MAFYIANGIKEREIKTNFMVCESVQNPKMTSLVSMSAAHAAIDKKVCSLLQTKTWIMRQNWDKVFKNGPRKLCGTQSLNILNGYHIPSNLRLSSTNFTYSILECFVPNANQVYTNNCLY